MAESDFGQALSNTIHRAVNLRIITLVGDAVVKGPIEELYVGAPAQSAGTLVTDINLVAGDITRIMSDKLLSPEFADLRNGRQDSIKQARDIVERNVNIVVTIAKEIGQQLGNLPAPSQGPVRTAI